jgi:hypothetical protein
MHPNSYAVLSRKVQDVFNALSKVQLGISAIALPALEYWSWSHGLSLRLLWPDLWLQLGFQLASLVCLFVLVQGTLLAIDQRANQAAGEWFVNDQAERQARAESCRPVKGGRTPPKHGQCPCKSGQLYKDCCRSLHQRAPARA